MLPGASNWKCQTQLTKAKILEFTLETFIYLKNPTKNSQKFESQPFKKGKICYLLASKMATWQPWSRQTRDIVRHH